jgi:hypothetical protein
MKLPRIPGEIKEFAALLFLPLRKQITIPTVAKNLPANDANKRRLSKSLVTAFGLCCLNPRIANG